MSTSAYLYFGFDFHDNEGKLECEWMSEFECDYDEQIAKVCGVVDDSGLFTSKGQFAFEKDTPEYEAADKKWNAYYDRKKVAIGELTFNNSVMIDSHGHCDYLIYYVRVKNHIAYCGDSMEIDASHLSINNEDMEKLKTFCQCMDIPWQEPKWYLASYWG